MITVEGIKKCYADLQQQGIWDDDESQFKKNFLKWSLKNHPDKNPGVENVTQLYQVISGCRSDFLENFNQYKNIGKGLYEAQKTQPSDTFNEFFKQYTQKKQQKPAPKKAKKTKSKAKKAKKSKTKKAKSAPKRKSKKAKSAPKKSKTKKAKSAPKRKTTKTKKAPTKSKTKKAKSAPKRKSKKAKSVPKKSKTKKAKSAPKKSKTKKAKSAPKKSKAKKSKKSTKSKKSKAKKQKGGKPATNPGEFYRKKQQRVNKPSPLRNEIKPDEEIKMPQIKRIKLIHKRNKSDPIPETPEWNF